ncbi:MAG: acyl-CoA dehydrogenase family protein [Pseudomonadota bacterium]
MTTNVQRFVDAVHTLGRAFAERAAKHDRDGSFVAENYVELKQHRFLSAPVPRELGGGGLSHSELCRVLRELAHYCSSTALALSMHMHLVATTVLRHRQGQPGEALLRKVATSELVLVSTGAGDWVDSVGRAEPVSGGYRITAVKRFCSGVPAGDLLITSAPLEREGSTSEVLHFPVPLRAEGVSILDDWDTLGMRATGSHSVKLDGVFVPNEAIVLRRPRGEWHPFWNIVVTVAAPLFMAPYVGIAERAAAIARDAVAGRDPDPLVVLGLGELENELAAMQMAYREMVELTNDYDVSPTLDHANRMLIRKTLTANAARACVAKAMALVGGRAFYRSMDLERLFRDVQGAALHPLPERKQQLFTGRLALGLAPIG